MNVLLFFLKEERRSSMVLLLAAIVALITANSSLGAQYFAFFGHHVSLGAVDIDIRHSVNEGLMVLFFLIVAMEVKREFVQGELNSWRRGSFPVLAAIGGMIVPALIFASFNASGIGSAGWAVPMATDIAIATGVIGLLGKRIPNSLRNFLLTLAVADDIGAILVIAIFYNHPANGAALLIASLAALGLYVSRKWRLWPLTFLGFGLVLWYCLTLSDISGTMTGIVAGLLIPVGLNAYRKKPLCAPEAVRNTLTPFVSFVIVPLFVLANAGVVLADFPAYGSESFPVLAGVALGLLAGKPAGIFLISWLGAKMGLAQKPKSIRWSQIVGVGFVAGIGFTVSLFVADLAYGVSAEHLRNTAVLGVFIGSAVSAVIGVLLLALMTRKSKSNA